jgi:hypothetical protein
MGEVVARIPTTAIAMFVILVVSVVPTFNGRHAAGSERQESCGRVVLKRRSGNGRSRDERALANDFAGAILLPMPRCAASCHSS